MRPYYGSPVSLGRSSVDGAGTGAGATRGVAAESPPEQGAFAGSGIRGAAALVTPAPCLSTGSCRRIVRPRALQGIDTALIRTMQTPTSAATVRCSTAIER